MSHGTAVSLARGLTHPEHTYIQLKNKAVYRYSLKLRPEDQLKLAARVKLNGNKVKLKHWIKVS